MPSAQYNVHRTVFIGMRSFSQSRVDANGLGRENVTGCADVFFAHVDATSESAVFANVAIPGFAGALRATGGIIGLW